MFCGPHPYSRTVLKRYVIKNKCLISEYTISPLSLRLFWIFLSLINRVFCDEEFICYSSLENVFFYKMNDEKVHFEFSVLLKKNKD